MLHEYGFVLVCLIFFHEKIINYSKNTLQPKQTGSNVHAQGRGMHAPKNLNYQLDINKDGAQAQAEVKLNNLHTFIHSRHTKTEANVLTKWPSMGLCICMCLFFFGCLLCQDK